MGRYLQAPQAPEARLRVFNCRIPILKSILVPCHLVALLFLTYFSAQRGRCCCSLRSLTIYTTISTMTILPNHGAAGTGSRLRPYLTTAQLISLCVLAAPLVSLIFVLFRLQASSDVAQQSVTQAKATLQASCLAAEHAATVGASLPRYLAQGVNDEITKSVRATMNGVRIGLTLR